eukprot:CAMPEP_0194047410 /NCGR_PEP_ID=MMETSP0009_2-20130614/24519_1 /TAXON_ID=210454 /ORGANISM="Grammatophora oceanica, Strain CCMP 410" /LENGTH=302 /DNA_ID=CAMNT_0038693025 /DNA_START=24 /DNA_END=932 /DNA_ORIENTATION=+
MMMKTAALLAIAGFASVADASTTVAVLEFGKGGAVRRTTTKNTETTVNGVASFWGALHSRSRQLQHSDMTVVPDLFKSADNGLVLGLTNVDLDAMPNLKEIVDVKSVGQMTMDGKQGAALCNKVGPTKEATVSSLVADSKDKMSAEALSSVKIAATEENSEALDKQLGALIAALEKLAGDETLVLHVVVEEEDGAARRRLASRRLEDEAEDEEDEEEEDQEDGEEDEENNNNDGYYGYGYYNKYGEWVVPYKTMFQIQYFNVVLWTAVGLVIALFYTVYLMVDMPFEADTLLFGESAKMMGE